MNSDANNDNAARDAFVRVWADWSTLSLQDGQVLQDEWLFKFGPTIYVTESLEGGPGALIWAVNDYWAIKLINGDRPADDVDRATWIPPGMCGLPDGYRQQEVIQAANRMERTRPATATGVYNLGSDAFKYIEVAATPGITVYYATPDMNSLGGPVIIQFIPDDIGPIEDNLTTRPR